MSDDEEILEAEESDGMGTIILMLGLYLIVLAFFILLNAISQDSPDRRELVVESVKEGFDFREPGEGTGSDNADITFPPLYETFSKDVEGIIEAHLKIDNYEVEKAPQKVRVLLNPKSFFPSGEVELIPDMILFFQDLAKALANPTPGMEVTTQVLVNSDETEITPQSKFDAFELAGRRAALFVRALVDEGVKKELISAGAFVGPPKITMTFDIHITDEATAQKEAQRLLNVLEKNDDLKVIEKEEMR